MPVVRGRVGEKSVDVLRDTCCSGIVVKRELVSEDHFTGDFNVMLLIDNTARKVPIVNIDVDTTYLKGQVEAQSLPDPIYGLVIGNVSGARAAYDPDPSWKDHVQEARTLTTRSQAKKSGESIPLEIPSKDENSFVDREKPKQKYVERSDKLSEPLKQAVDQIQKLSEALKQEQVPGWREGGCTCKLKCYLILHIRWAIRQLPIKSLKIINSLNLCQATSLCAA